ncbi:MAG: alpha-N-arabinofuranosidase [Armatimonadota bacterium]
MNTLIVHADAGSARINKNIYGHFAEHLGRCIYEGFWVGEDSPIPNTRGIRNDVVAALKRINPPVLRWPGGCFADEYHWMDGIGPREARPAMINTHWGGVTENNHFGTHEFFDLCEMLGAEPYICGNVGSGTVREMQQWVEYCTFPGVSPMADLRRKHGREEPWRLPFFGVGNENWGCGGLMRAEYYADQYRQYAIYLRNLGGNTLYKIACGPGDEDFHWTEVLMREAGQCMEGLSLHHYAFSGSWTDKGSAVEFDEQRWFTTLKHALQMEALIIRHGAIMDQYDEDKQVGLIVDEWGAWYDVEPGANPGFLYQQNTLRDALVAGMTLNIFNQHCDRVQMANIAQIVNVLQAMVLTDGEKMLTTPTYHVFEMYKVHQQALLLPTTLISNEYACGEESIPAISASASRDDQGKVHITLCNADPNSAQEITCALRGMEVTAVSGRVLTAETMNAHNTFEQPEVIAPREFTAITRTPQGISLRLPAKSVVVVTLS